MFMSVKNFTISNCHQIKLTHNLSLIQNILCDQGQVKEKTVSRGKDKKTISREKKELPSMVLDYF